ncbi:hypothetical protein ARTHRO9AX_80437 [Arthrobacter sp. 9AX]|nr:hypothetical protein ARTHRO9AX_80437 [Arthrobacter sp. 9AX]
MVGPAGSGRLNRRVCSLDVGPFSGSRHTAGRLSSDTLARESAGHRTCGGRSAVSVIDWV